MKNQQIDSVTSWILIPEIQAFVYKVYNIMLMAGELYVCMLCLYVLDELRAYAYVRRVTMVRLQCTRDELLKEKRRPVHPSRNSCRHWWRPLVIVIIIFVIIIIVIVVVIMGGRCSSRSGAVAAYDVRSVGLKRTVQTETRGTNNWKPSNYRRRTLCSDAVCEKISSLINRRWRSIPTTTDKSRHPTCPSDIHVRPTTSPTSSDRLHRSLDGSIGNI